MYTLTLTVSEDEYWWGGCADDGVRMPFCTADTFQRCLDPNPTTNQAVPLLLSSRGRSVFCESGFTFRMEDGKLTVTSVKSPLILSEGQGSLAGAFRDAAANHFPPAGQMPDERMFTLPQYNTWIAFLYNQEQEGILRYAEEILAEGYPAGVLMIDDGWQCDYGTWEFNRASFPDPAAMVRRLHDLGFSVMLWVCPFVSPDSVVYRALRDRGLLVRAADGEPAIKRWWDGYSAVLDLSNPAAEAWMHEQLSHLMSDYGVDGFKFDAGDAIYYSEDDRTYAPTDPNRQSEAWARLGSRYRFNEYRACFGCSGLGLAQRLRDKTHRWDENGVSSLVPNALAEGIIGHPFVCPDMIGGGESQNFTENAGHLDAELFVRYAQCAALMPMMQYSAAPWRVLDREHADLCRAAADLHTAHAPLILDLARRACRTGEPIIRYLSYVFPDGGFEKVTDQFLLGDRLLVAPVLRKGERSRTVVFPDGVWEAPDGTRYTAGTHTVPAPLDTLPHFYRRDS